MSDINILASSVGGESVIREKVIDKVERTASVLAMMFVGVTALNARGIDLVAHTSDKNTRYCVNYLDISNDREEISMSNNISVDLMQIDNINKINKMKMFQDDWNGTGGVKFTEKAISTFIDVIEHLDVQPWIAPTGRNSLLMQYELGDGSKLAYELMENRLDEVYVPNGNFSRAVTATYTHDFGRHVGERVKIFYGV